MGVLLMLMTIGGSIIAAMTFVFALITKKRWLARFMLAGVAIWLIIYAVMLLGFSLASTEKVLAAGEAKAYCGFYLDCHMHTAVTGVRTASTVGERKAAGLFYIVSIRVFSDAKNPEIALRLIEPKARVVLADGRQLDRDEAAEGLLPSAKMRLDADITNSGPIGKEIVFDVPANAANAKLLITEGYGIDKAIEHLLVGDDDSFLHAQTFFELNAQNDTAGVK